MTTSIEQENACEFKVKDCPYWLRHEFTKQEGCFLVYCPISYFGDNTDEGYIYNRNWLGADIESLDDVVIIEYTGEWVSKKVEEEYLMNDGTRMFPTRFDDFCLGAIPLRYQDVYLQENLNF